ncbi:MAG: PEP/pyruvate-binding domain-containing protein [Clostridiales Family XIII bacterium]|jgi:hypothetical protein|nr:PEP/pyruvate-binding domain-containing protein [Clostridiales Family XIII bacterium]
MMINQKRAYSGLNGLDEAIDYMRYGDSVVWQIENFKEYAFFVRLFVEKSVKENKNVVYFRFAEHPPLIDHSEFPNVHIKEIDYTPGFEHFVMSISDTIEEEGSETHYIFDSMTSLQVAWGADFMMGNFFVVTAPEIKRTNSIAYFAYKRNHHSFESMARIREVANVLFDIFPGENRMYFQPIIVDERYHPSIFLPHTVKMDPPYDIKALTNGIDLAHYFSIVSAKGDVDSAQNLDNWERFFMQKKTEAKTQNDLRELYTMIFGQDEHILSIAEKNVNMADIMSIKARMIGVGGIGGKATGMILARKIVEKNLPDISKLLEPHDSFYVCSNLYYTFLIKNKCWSLKIKQRKKRGYFTVAEIIKERILEGEFSDNIRDQFRRMLEYYGQSPIIVRSSSLLEDAFGNAFAGKYESVFCVNKGTLEERLLAFEDAVRVVYASTMDESVLEYRLKRGLAAKEEQMALLVQRVTGSLFKDYYMPAAAGVGFSYNAYRFSKDIDPHMGMVRLVMGLGTRAVDRTDGDYPRIAALDHPDLSAIKKKYDSDFSQKKVDVLDLTTNSLVTKSLEEIQGKMAPWFKNIMLERDRRHEAELKILGIDKTLYYTTCNNLLKKKEFIGAISSILKTIEHAYNYPVDIEFALNISKDFDFVINLLQCRPLQVGGNGIRESLPAHIDTSDIFFALNGGTMGGAYSQDIDVVIQVMPKLYYEYPYNQKSVIARIIGQINEYYDNTDKVIMLLVPGRIGTSSPELGVPVTFAEISEMSIVCEVSYEGAGYMPELSFGSHFFQDLVEADIFYASIFENKDTTELYNQDFFAQESSHLLEMTSDIIDADAADVVRVYQPKDGLKIISDIESGKTICYRP